MGCFPERSAFGDSRAPGTRIPREPGLQNADCVLPACKRTACPGKLVGTHSQWRGGDERSYQGARVLPGVAGADPGHCATGQEHQLGPLLSLMSVLVFNHPLRVQKTLIQIPPLFSLYPMLYALNPGL